MISGCAVVAVLLAATSGAGPAVGSASAAGRTVIFTVVAADGSSVPSGEITIINTDSFLRDYPGTATVKAGRATVKLPAGHYAALGVDKSGTAANRVTRIVPITDFTVAAKSVKLTVDYRRADQRPSVSVPRAVTRKNLAVSWLRFDAEFGLPIGVEVSVGTGGDILVAPETRTQVGRVSVTYSWQLAQAGSAPTYTYDLAVNTDGFQAAQGFIFTKDDLATVTSSYYGAGGPERTGAFLRYPNFVEDSGAGAIGKYQPVTRGTRRIEYVGSRGSTPLWSETARADSSDAVKDPGRTDVLNKQPIPARAHQTRTWFRGPVTPGVPTFREQDGGLCLACQGTKALELVFSPLTDSVSDHVGLMKNSAGNPPVARFRAYRNGRKVKDSKGIHTLVGWDAGLFGGAHLAYMGGRITTPAASARYKAVLDVDRRAQKAGVSTVSRTTLAFSTRPGHGALPPSDWGCITSQFNCRVLPLLMAHLSMPLRLDGTLAACRSTFTLKVARIQHAQRSKITAVTLSVRPAGQKKWLEVRLRPAGKGRYTATIDNTAWAGSAIDVRYSARDAGGSTFAQTVQRAYVVRGA